MKQITFRISDQLRDTMRNFCIVHEMTQQQMIERAVATWLLLPEKVKDRICAQGKNPDKPTATDPPAASPSARNSPCRSRRRDAEGQAKEGEENDCR